VFVDSRLFPITTACDACEKQLFPSIKTLVMEFETKIYPQIGGFGRYNRIVTLFSWFPNFAVSLNLFSDVFFTLIPESYHCKPDLRLFPASSVLGNLSRQAVLNLTVPWMKGSGFSHCELYKYPLNTSNLTESAPRDTVPCTVGWEFAKPAGLQNNLVTEVSIRTEPSECEPNCCEFSQVMTRRVYFI